VWKKAGNTSIHIDINLHRIPGYASMGETGTMDLYEDQTLAKYAKNAQCGGFQLEDVRDKAI